MSIFYCNNQCVKGCVLLSKKNDQIWGRIALKWRKIGFSDFFTFLCRWKFIVLFRDGFGFNVFICVMECEIFLLMVRFIVWIINLKMKNIWLFLQWIQYNISCFLSFLVCFQVCWLLLMTNCEGLMQHGLDDNSLQIPFRSGQTFS